MIRRGLLALAVIEGLLLAILAAWFGYLYLERTDTLRPAVLVAMGIAGMVAVATAAWKGFVLARRRNFRFSLRSLMVATVALCVLLAITVISVRRMERERAAQEAVQLIRSLDGSIGASRPPGLPSDAPVEVDFTDPRFAVGLTFTETPLDASQVAQLAPLTGIVSITFVNTVLREDAVLRLASWPNLRVVVLENSPVIAEDAASSTHQYNDVTTTTIARLRTTAPNCRVFQTRAELQQWAREQVETRNPVTAD